MSGTRADVADRHRRGSSTYQRVQIALAVVGLTTFAQLYYPQALIPMVSRDLEVAAADAALTLSGATIGLAAAVLCWSWVADRIGRAPAIKIALVAAGVLGLLAPLAPSLDILVALRLLQGIALGGTPALALTYLAEEVDRRDAALAAGSYISGTVLGGLAGRVIAAPIAAIADWRVAGLVIAGLSIAGAVMVLALLPAARHFRRPTRREPGTPRRSTWTGVAASLKNIRLLVLYTQGALLCGAYVATYNYLGYRLEQEPFSLPSVLTAAIFVTGLSGAWSARFAGRLATRYGRRRVLLASAAAMGAGAALMIPDWLPAICAGLLILTIAYFAAHSIASGWVGATAETGTAQANSLYSLFYYTGSSLLGWVGGLAFTAGWTGTAILVLGAISTALACAALSRLGRTPTEPAKAHQDRPETDSAKSST